MCFLRLVLSVRCGAAGVVEFTTGTSVMGNQSIGDFPRLAWSNYLLQAVSDPRGGMTGYRSLRSNIVLGRP